MSIETRLPQVQSFLDTRREIEAVPYVPEKVSVVLKEIAEKLAAITGRWNPLEIFTPTVKNRDAEKAAFLAAFAEGKEYAPQYEYVVADGMDVSKEREQIQAFLSEVRSHKPENEQDRLYRVALYGKLRDDLATCYIVDGLKNKDDEMLKTALQIKYPSPDKALIATAHTLYEELIKKPEGKVASVETPLLSPQQQELLKTTTVNAEQIKAAFEYAMKRYGMLKDDEHPDGFQVIVGDSTVTIDVRDKSEQPMTVYIPTDRKMTADKMLELIAHEIEGHVRQSMNGMRLFGIGGGALKVDSETLYEGLAKRLDESFRKRFFGVDAGTPGPWYVLAIERAEQGATFYEVFKDQYEKQLHVLLKVPHDQPLELNEAKHKKDMDEAAKSAWMTTYRVMRPRVDMSNPLGYAMSKDIGYLQGWMMDKQLQEAGYGGINEMAVLQTGGLQLMARLGIADQQMPFPYQDVTKEYCFDVLLPQLEASRQTPPTS